MNTTQKIPFKLDQNWASYEFWKIGYQNEIT